MIRTLNKLARRVEFILTNSKLKYSSPERPSETSARNSEVSSISSGSVDENDNANDNAPKASTGDSVYSFHFDEAEASGRVASATAHHALLSQLPLVSATSSSASVHSVHTSNSVSTDYILYGPSRGAGNAENAENVM